MSTLPFYREQASRQQIEADAATLSNVRERCQRAADAWTVLADRLQRADDLRTSKSAADEAKLLIEQARSPEPAEQ